MNHGIWISIVIICSIVCYRYGFREGDAARRLYDVDYMVSQTEEERQRHVAEENYWNDRAWDCEAKIKKMQEAQP